MKKIILSFLALFLLISCGSDNEKSGSQQNMEVSKNQDIVQESTLEISTGSQIEDEEKITATGNISESEMLNQDDMDEIDFVPLIEDLELDTVTYQQILENISRLKKVYKQDESFLRCMQDGFDTCFSQAVSNQAILQSDKNICGEMSSDYLQQECEKTFIVQEAKKLQDITYCDEIKNDIFYNLNCRYEVAVELVNQKNDLSYCEQIFVEEVGNGNITNIGSESLDENLIGTSFDDNQYAKDMVQSCISSQAFGLASKLQDDSYCREIEEIEQKLLCKQEVKRLQEFQELGEMEGAEDVLFMPILPE